jgi:hypothetical protein
MIYQLTEELQKYLAESEKHFSDINKQKALEAAFDKTTRIHIQSYIKEKKQQPFFLKELKLSLDDPDMIKKLLHLEIHQGALTAIAQKTMKLRFKVLTRGQESYSVDEKRNFWSKLGRWIDDPRHKSKFMNKHPGFKEFM